MASQKTWDPPKPDIRSIADKVLNDTNPGAAKTQSGRDVGNAPATDLRRPVVGK